MSYLTHCSAVKQRACTLLDTCMSNLKAIICTVGSFCCMQSKYWRLGQQFFDAPSPKCTVWTEYFAVLSTFPAPKKSVQSVLLLSTIVSYLLLSDFDLDFLWWPRCKLFCCWSPLAPCCTCRSRTSPDIALTISPLSSGSYHDIVAAPEWVPVHLHRVQIGVGIASLSLASDRSVRILKQDEKVLDGKWWLKQKSTERRDTW